MWPAKFDDRLAAWAALRSQTQSQDVESALTELENTVVQISDGVATGKKFQKPSGISIDSDEDFTTPARKGKKPVRHNDTPAKGSPCVQHLPKSVMTQVHKK